MKVGVFLSRTHQLWRSENVNTWKAALTAVSRDVTLDGPHSFGEERRSLYLGRTGRPIHDCLRARTFLNSLLGEGGGYCFCVVKMDRSTCRHNRRG